MPGEFIPPKDRVDLEEWEAEQSRKQGDAGRHREATDYEVQQAIRPKLEDAVMLAAEIVSLRVKLNSLQCLQRDDDQCGWWVPCFVFVQGGKSERPENSSD
jgi:hypothetical protein